LPGHAEEGDLVDEASCCGRLVMKHAMPIPINGCAAAIAVIAHIPLPEMLWRRQKARAIVPSDATAQQPATATNG
jgi:hypothetical protein